jgi:hypothetical protein
MLSPLSVSQKKAKVKKREKNTGDVHARRTLKKQGTCAHAAPILKKI